MSLNVVLIKLVAILMMSAKLTTLDLLKIKVFWNKIHDVIISLHDVTSKIYLDSNYIVDVVMWEKFLWEKLSSPQFYKDWTRKNNFFEGRSWFKFNNLGQALGMALKIYTSVAKMVEAKSQKMFKANSYVCWNYRGKTSGRGLFTPPSKIGLKLFSTLKAR